MNNYVLYSTSTSIDFAKSIAQHLKMDLNLVNKDNFSDGEIDIEFDESVRGKSIILVAQIFPSNRNRVSKNIYENLFEVVLTCDAAKRSDASEIILVIPYLPHSRQERREDKRKPISARVIADVLQNAGVNHIISMDLHIGAIEGFYSIPFDKLQPTELFIKEMKLNGLENRILVSPDYGFVKKMEAYKDALGLEMCIISKKRSGPNKIESMELSGDVSGKRVIIVDDIIDTAGTLKKASELLIEKGALSVDVFATHGILSGNAIEKNINQSEIDNLYLSNTIDVKATRDVIVIDVTPIFANAIIKKMNA